MANGKAIAGLALALVGGLILYMKVKPTATSNGNNTNNAGGGNNNVPSSPTAPSVSLPGSNTNNSPTTANDYMDYTYGNVMLRIIGVDILSQCIQFAVTVAGAQIFADTWCNSDAGYTHNTGSNSVVVNPDGNGNVLISVFDSSNNLLLSQSIIIPGYLG